MNYTVHGILLVRILKWVAFPSPGDLPNPGMESRSPTFQADSLLAQPQRKPKNTGVGSLSPLWGIFLTQESNYGLLHHKRILYQLSHQGCPFGVCSCILCLLIFLFYQLTFFNEKINIAIIPYQQIGNKRKKCLQSHPNS